MINPFYALVLAASTLLAKPQAIVILGSSTAAGKGATTYDSAWVGRFQSYVKEKDPNYTIINLGFSGGRTFHALPTEYKYQGRPVPDPARNITKALASNPIAIIVNFPSNDIRDNVPLDEQKRNFEILDSTSRAEGVPIWFCTTQPRTDLDPLQRTQLIAMKTWILERFPQHSIDFWSELATPDGLIAPQYQVPQDAVHLNNRGHEVLANRVIKSSLSSFIPSLAIPETEVVPPPPEPEIEPPIVTEPAPPTFVTRPKPWQTKTSIRKVYDLLGRIATETTIRMD